MKELKDTLRFMNSTDFKERAIAEYWQLKIRCEKLEAMCKGYRAGTLGFTPNCPVELLEKQLGYMQDYMAVLELRADVEGIDLNGYGVAKPCTEDENEGKPVSVVTKGAEEGTLKVSIEGDYKETYRALVSALVIAFLHCMEGKRDEMKLGMADFVGADVVRAIRKRLLEEDADSDKAEEEKA